MTSISPCMQAGVLFSCFWSTGFFPWTQDCCHRSWTAGTWFWRCKPTRDCRSWTDRKRFRSLATLNVARCTLTRPVGWRESKDIWQYQSNILRIAFCYLFADPQRHLNRSQKICPNFPQLGKNHLKVDYLYWWVADLAKHLHTFLDWSDWKFIVCVWGKWDFQWKYFVRCL